jgi:coenzyme F420-reducing hydrogenase delta subunit
LYNEKYYSTGVEEGKDTTFIFVSHYLKIKFTGGNEKWQERMDPQM